MPYWLGLALPFVVFLGFFVLLRKQHREGRVKRGPLTQSQKRVRLWLLLGEMVALLLLYSISTLWIQLLIIAAIVAMPLLAARQIV